MRCDLCGRVAVTTRHHLVPRSRGGRGSVGRLCRDCHRMAHATFTNHELAREYPTVDRLRRAPELASWIRWIRRRPSATYFGSRNRAR